MAVVYQHRRLDTNEVFYIGIGKTKKRAWVKKNRNKYWLNIVNCVGYTVEILYEDITWIEACNLEIALISFYKSSGNSLVNMTEGGSGGDTLSKHPNSEAIREKKSKTMRDFYSKKTKQELKEIYGQDPNKIREQKLKLYESELARKKCGREGSTHWAYGSKQKKSTIEKRIETIKQRGGYCARTKGSFAPKPVTAVCTTTNSTIDFVSVKECVSFLKEINPAGKWTRDVIQSLLLKHKKGILKVRNGYIIKYKQ